VNADRENYRSHNIADPDDPVAVAALEAETDQERQLAVDAIRQCKRSWMVFVCDDEGVTTHGGSVGMFRDALIEFEALKVAMFNATLAMHANLSDAMHSAQAYVAEQEEGA
jgi:hypothetical protein